MQKTCLFSGKTFTVRDADLVFLEKFSPVIGGKKQLISPPSFCPEERDRRRYAYRNDHNLFKRKSSLSGENIISFYHPDSPYKIYSHQEWWSDNWNPLDYGKDFDFNRGFFEQFHQLQLQVPRSPLVNNNAINSDYCNFSDDNKNCYLLAAANRNEDCYYSFLIVDNKNLIDCLWCTNCELMYECTDCRGCYNLKYCQNCEGCNDGAWLLNCQSTKNCLFCIGLYQKQYYLFNKQTSKEEYKEAITEISGSYTKLQEVMEKFDRLKKDFNLRPANHIIASQNIIGDNVYNSKNIFQGFDVYESENCAYLHDGLKAKDCADVSFFDQCELCYESTSLLGNYQSCFNIYCRHSNNLFYCDSCYGCNNCFGCVGLRNKSFCLFNNQYSQDEYEKQVPGIIKHMKKNNEWGEFFPVKYSPLAYNESLAQDYYPLSKEETDNRRWEWRDSAPELKASKTIPSEKLPDSINDIPDDIVNWAVICQKTKKPFKIILQELKFYREQNLPVPRLHPGQRRKDRLGRRNPRKLYQRKCNLCQKEIFSIFSETDPEEIVCHECYRKQM